MLDFPTISLVQRSISIGINARRYIQSSLSDEKHTIGETKPVSLDNLSPVVRQILSKDASYAVRFGGQAENIFSQIPKDDIILSTNDDEDDLPHPPIVAFPSIENHFEIGLGTEDKTILPHERARCFGCGVLLQCADKNKPGFISVEIYKHYLSTNLQKRTINEQIYNDILKEIKRKRALVILILDLLDIPNSISRSWSHLIDESTENLHTSPNIIFILGNKVDHFTKGFILDSENYLSDVRKCLENECTKRGLGKHIVKYYGLISARTRYGIEELIEENISLLATTCVYLLEGTNTEKSNLFNNLIDSDLCHIRALDCIQRATLSNLPVQQ
ncbi:unnamed protein product [Rotaria sp. Silwood1]|nr:unnamed protein product [Rotaria sp. Silwood1]CAF1383561.1 unnamed protein product [Rotaria sp. Silwood1]CAF1390490.1 unnamed protein product [Rotaria sp. Silwood1]CAF3567714.1 unnamed protein product [Rotaria sp. Silwood1]